MLRRTLTIALAAALIASSAAAQQAPAAPAKEDKPAPRPPAPEGLPNNIRIELTITDQAGPGAAEKRTVSMMVADRKAGSIRSQGRVTTAGQSAAVTLNVDASPVIVKDGQMRLDLGLEYVPKPGSENATSGEGRGSLNQRLSLLVESGRPLVVSQASDPTSDRKISVELTATILK
jgi:hypothetical protein